MIGHSLPEFVFIRLSIAALRLIAPLSIAYLAASWYTGRWFYSCWLGYYALAESLFYLAVYLPRTRVLQHVSSPVLRYPLSKLYSHHRCPTSCSQLNTRPL